MKAEALTEIRSYDARVEKFENMVVIVQTKFKRLTGDWDQKRDILENLQKNITKRQESMIKELSGYSRIISSLVELEYIQQTLDI